MTAPVVVVVVSPVVVAAAVVVPAVPVVEPPVADVVPPCAVQTSGTNSGLYTPTAFFGHPLVAILPVA